jgi:probable blue pigment (indigoidine) exporter
LPADRPLLVATLRVLPAGLVLLAATWRRHWRPRGRGWAHTAALALMNFGCFFPLLAVAIYRLPGGVAAAFGGLQPLLVAGLTSLLTGRPPSRSGLAVGVVAAIVVALVAVRPGADLDGVGALAAVAANVSFAAGVVATRLLPAPSDRLAATGWQLLLGGAVLLPLTLAVEGPPPPLEPSHVAGTAYLSLVGTALAFTLWFGGIRRLGPAAPPLLGLAAPVTGAALGWIVLDQSLGPTQLIGFVVTLSAVGYGAIVAAGPASTDERAHGVVEHAEVGVDVACRRRRAHQRHVVERCQQHPPIEQEEVEEVFELGVGRPL